MLGQERYTVCIVFAIKQDQDLQLFLFDITKVFNTVNRVALREMLIKL